VTSKLSRQTRAPSGANSRSFVVPVIKMFPFGSLSGNKLSPDGTLGGQLSATSPLLQHKNFINNKMII
jgi:hypothetical protein